MRMTQLYFLIGVVFLFMEMIVFYFRYNQKPIVKDMTIGQTVFVNMFCGLFQILLWPLMIYDAVVCIRLKREGSRGY